MRDIDRIIPADAVDLMIPSHADPADRVLVIGFTWAPRSHEVRDFLARSRVPYLFRDYESNDRARARADELGRTFPRAQLLVADLADPGTLNGLGRQVDGEVDAEHPLVTVQLTRTEWRATDLDLGDEVWISPRRGAQAVPVLAAADGLVSATP